MCVAVRVAHGAHHACALQEYLQDCSPLTWHLCSVGDVERKTVNGSIRGHGKFTVTIPLLPLSGEDSSKLPLLYFITISKFTFVQLLARNCCCAIRAIISAKFARISSPHKRSP